MKNNYLTKTPVTQIIVACFCFIQIGCSSSRYIKTVKKPSNSIENSLKVFTDFEREDVVKMEGLLRESQANAMKSDAVKGINESIFLLIDNQIAFTVVIKDKNITVKRGKTEGASATLYIPFNIAIAGNLKEAMSDSKLDKAELFNFAYVLIIPCLNRIYSMPFLYKSNMSMGNLENFTQFEIKNPEGHTYHSKKIDINATVLNVDGMFHVFPGLMGDPDIRVALTIEQALEMYKFIAYDTQKEMKMSEKMKLINQYKDLIKENTVYERSWH